MAWPIVLAAVGAAAGVFNAMDEYSSNRTIRRDMAKIKAYVAGLVQAVSRIEAQNAEILSRLDRLPAEIRRIVAEEVASALLEERYSEVNNIRDNYLLLQNGRGYGIRDEEWLRFSSAMTYLFDHENRVSRTFDLIVVSEIALVITRERSQPLVLKRLEDRLRALQDLYQAFDHQVQGRLLELQMMLGAPFIADHNLNEQLPSFDLLMYAAAPDRTRVETVFERECLNGPFRICFQRPVTRIVPDTAFNDARDQHVQAVEAKRQALAPMLYELGVMVATIKAMERHIARVTEGSSLNPALEPVMYFHDGDALTEQALAGLPDDVRAGVVDYLDLHVPAERVELADASNTSFARMADTGLA